MSCRGGILRCPVRHLVHRIRCFQLHCSQLSSSSSVKRKTLTSNSVLPICHAHGSDCTSSSVMHLAPWWAAAECLGGAQANLPKPGGFSAAVVDAGKKVTGSLPNPPNISNPKDSAGVPTLSKVTKNPVKDLSDGSFAAGDNKPSFPTAPVKNPDQDQDVFKQIGDAFRGAIPDGAPNPGKLGEEIAENAGGPNVKGAASEVTQNLPEKIQNTADSAPAGIKTNARNEGGNFNNPRQ